MALLNTGSLSRVDAVHLMAGTFILVSLALYYWVSEWFLIIPAFVGANLFQYGLTGACPAEYVFGKLLGLPCPCDENYNPMATKPIPTESPTESV